MADAFCEREEEGSENFKREGKKGRVWLSGMRRGYDNS